MSGFILGLCWKNLWRNKRRSFLTMAAISLGVMWIVWAYNYYDAFHDQLIRNAIRYGSGHAVLSTEAFKETLQPRHRFRYTPYLDGWLRKREELKSFSPRVRLLGLLSSAENSVNLQMVGIHPNLERTTTHYADAISQGTYFEEKRTDALVLGSKVAKKLGAQIGSKVVALAQGADGSIGNELFYVTGIFDSGTQMDGELAFIPIERARALLSLGRDEIHEVSVLLHSDRALTSFTQAYRGDFSGKVILMTWMDLQKQVMAIIDLHQSANRILMWLILLVASLGITNAILMGIMERKKEFGILLAMGTPTGQLSKMILAETLLLTSVATLVGNVLGIGLTLYFQKQGFDLRWFTSQEVALNGMLVEAVTYPTIQWLNSGVTTVTIFILAGLSAWIPIRHVSRMRAAYALVQ